MKTRNWGVLLSAIFIMLVSGCTPRADGEADGIVWRIRVKARDSQLPEVTKEVWAVREVGEEPELEGYRWQAVKEYDPVTLSCEPKGGQDTVYLGPGFIEFKRGGYIVCDDKPLAEIIGTDYRLEDLTSSTDCSGDFGCIVRTSDLLLNVAGLEVSSVLPFTIFTYPQYNSTGPAEDWVKLAMSKDNEGYIFDWSLLGLEDDERIIIDEEKLVTDVTRQRALTAVERKLNGTAFTYAICRDQIEIETGSCPNSNEDTVSSPGEILFSEDTRFEFSAEVEKFYIGDWPGEFEEQDTLRISEIFFDPNDSCSGCQ